MHDRLFVGSRDKRGRPMVVVWEGRRARPLASYDELNALSPDYDWGRRSSGTDQLAHDLVVVAFGDEDFDRDLIEVFTADVAVSLPATWSLTAAEVRAWIGDLVVGCLALSKPWGEGR